MTAEELRKLGAEIHQRVMGQKCFEKDGEWWETFEWMTDFYGKPWPCRIPNYPTEIEPAWRVVEELKKRTATRSRRIELHAMTSKQGKPLYLCQIWYSDICCSDDVPIVAQYADTAPLAICLAAATAVAQEAHHGQA